MSEETTVALAADLENMQAEKLTSSAFNRSAPQSAPETTPNHADISALKVVTRVKIDRSRDDLLTDFGKTTLVDRYLLPEESYQDMFARVSEAYCDDAAHAQRLYDYMSQLWFMPATPILSNGGAKRGLPISCFLNAVDDSLDSIVQCWTQNVMACFKWRRHWYILGQCALYWRKNWSCG